MEKKQPRGFFKTLMLITGGIIACIVGVGVSFGLFIASLIDSFMLLKPGAIWGITLTVTTVIIVALYLWNDKKLEEAIKKYSLWAGLFSLPWIILALFMEGDIFYMYTLHKSHLENLKHIEVVDRERGDKYLKTIDYICYRGSYENKKDTHSSKICLWKDANSDKYAYCIELGVLNKEGKEENRELNGLANMQGNILKISQKDLSGNLDVSKGFSQIIGNLNYEGVNYPISKGAITDGSDYNYSCM